MQADYLSRMGFVALLSLVTPSSVLAANTLLYNPAMPGCCGFSQPADEGRQMLFQVLNAVTINELGAEIDPADSTQTLDWRIYNSDNAATIGSLHFSMLGTIFNDVGMSIYDVSVNVDLSPGFYLLELHNASNQTLNMQRYNESQQGGLPRLSADGNFSSIDGFRTVGGSANDLGSLEANLILPAFSVTVASLAVPLPGAIVLLASALLGLIVHTRPRP